MTRSRVSVIFATLVITLMVFIFFPEGAYGASSMPVGMDGIVAGEEKYNSGDAAEAIKIFMHVAENAAEEHDYSTECLSEYNIGVVYLSLYSNGEALQHFQKAYDLCRRHNLGPGREVEIMSGISGAFFQSNSYVKAKNTLRQALSIAYANSDSAMISIDAEDMALICNHTNDYDSVAYWLDESRRFSPPGRSTANLLSIAAETAMIRSDYAQADSLCRAILDHSLSSGSNWGLAYSYLFEMASAREDWEAAETYQKEALKYSGINLKPHIFDVGARMYEKRGDYRLAMQYKDSVMTYKDSLERVNNEQLLDNENVKLEVLMYQLEAEQTLEKQKIQTWIWISIAIVFFFVIVISAILWRVQLLRNRTQREMLRLRLENERREKELAEERIRETEMESRHEQEILKKEIERRNTQLQANAMFVSSKNELIEDLLKQLDSIREEKQEISNLRSYLARLISNDSKVREEFMTNVEASDPELSRRLMASHPDLLQSDLKFLGYIRMNLSMKEIATILNVNPDSCKRRKIRISKKLGLESSADLYSYLLHLMEEE